MSDSLLNLLEVLNEVLEEQGLQEQESGGAPTEQELWDIVSPGLLDYITGHYEEVKAIIKTPAGEERKARAEAIGRSSKITSLKTFGQKLEAFKQGLEGKNLIYAYPLIENQLLNGENTDTNLQKILKVGAWLIRLNEYYNKSDKDSKLPINPEAITSIFEPEKRNPLKKGKGEIPKNINIATILTTNEKSPLRNIGIVGSSETDRLDANLKATLATFLVSLSEGTGFLLSRSALGTSGNNLATLEEPKYFLDKFDYEKASNMILSGDVKQAQKALTILSNSLSKIDQSKYPDFNHAAHKKKVISIIEKGFSNAIKNRKYSLKLANSLSKTYQNNRNRKKKEKQHTAEFLELVGNFIKKVNSLEDYGEKLKSAQSGETFTDPNISPFKISQTKDFDIIIKQFFGADIGTNLEQKFNMLFKKMQIFTLPEEQLKNQINQIGVKDFMNRVLLMEYFIKITKGFSSISSGLLFEYFLAKLFNGEVVGMRGDAVDFTTPDGNKGSAKLFSPSTLRKQRQAIASFQPHIGKEITYVLGNKVASQEKITGSEQATEPLEIEKIDIYTSIVRFDGEKTKDGNYILNVIEKDGGKKSIQSSKASFNLQTLIEEKNYVGTLQIMTTTEDGIKGFRQRVKKAVTGDTKKILVLVEQLFKNLRLADEKSRIYTSSGEVSDGTEALRALTDSQTNLREIGDYAFKDKEDEYDKLPDPNDA